MVLARLINSEIAILLILHLCVTFSTYWQPSSSGLLYMNSEASD
jgi:hypothetical protein